MECHRPVRVHAAGGPASIYEGVVDSESLEGQVPVAVDENVWIGRIAWSSVLRVSNRSAVPFEFVIHIEIPMVEAPLRGIYGAIRYSIKFVTLTGYEIPCLRVSSSRAGQEQNHDREKVFPSADRPPVGPNVRHYFLLSQNIEPIRIPAFSARIPVFNMGNTPSYTSQGGVPPGEGY